MTKRFKEELVVDVPADVIYQYYKENFKAIVSSKNRYDSLKRHSFHQIEDIPGKKLAFQEKYFFTRATNELKLEEQGDEKTRALLTVEVSWSPWRKKIGQSLLLGMTSNLRSLERMYRIIGDHYQDKQKI